MTNFYETLAVASFRNFPLSVTLARAQDSDVPIMGCSIGFEILNGYTQAETVGRNCRFLSSGCYVQVQQRHAMRVSVRTGKPFAGVIENRRKNGETFDSLLYLNCLRIGDANYILGIQHDVSGQRHRREIDICSDVQYQMQLKQVVDAIFANIDRARSFQQATVSPSSAAASAGVSALRWFGSG